jgi:cytochrome c2
MRVSAFYTFLSAPLLALGLAAAAGAENESAAVFAKKCASCHTFGKGDTVGPDLKGVTSRRPRPWLVSWIQSSDRLIRAGDPQGILLFKKYKQQRMPDHDLSKVQVEALLDYLEAEGPLQAAAPRRRASAATRQEVEFGKDLFLGKVALANGGVACATCHSVSKNTAGSLGSDLTRAYAKYQDKGLTSMLERTCFPRLPSADGTAPVTAKESFALKAFLHRANDEAR